MNEKHKTIVTEADIGNVLECLSDRFDRDLYAKTQEQLDENWFFRFDFSASLESNIYSFYDMLNLYAGFCRRWEDHHRGICCVVERVRDRYLWPKIEQFAADVRKQMKGGES